MSMQKRIEWNLEKNMQLLRERGVTFEMVESLWDTPAVVEILPNPNAEKYLQQFVAIIKIADYMHTVPYVEDEEKIFLKTIIPNSYYQKIYNSK
jgi:uncharacterized DUF497 family protein